MAESRGIDRIAGLRKLLNDIAEPKARMQATLKAVDEFVMSEPDSARLLLNELCTEAEASGDDALLARGSNRLADLCRRQGELDRATGLARRALEAAQRSKDRLTEAAIWNTTGLIHYDWGEFSRAQACHQRCLEMSRESGYVDGELAALNQLATLMGMQGRASEALACYERCLTIDVERGSSYGEVVSRGNVAWMLEQFGRWEEATEQLYRAIAISEQEGYEDSRLALSCNLGELFVKRRRLEQATALFDSVIRVERGREPPRAMLGRALAHLGQAMSLRGDLGAAAATYTEAAAILETVQDKYSLTHVLLLNAELSLNVGELSEAETHIGRAAGLAAEQELKRELGGVLRVRGLLFAKVGDYEAAQDCFERALSEFADTPESYETARVCLQYGHYLAARGEAVRARTLLRQASGTFRRLSVVAESEQANRLLFELDIPERGATAVLAGLQGLERVGLEPRSFVNEVLALLLAGMGLTGTAIECDEVLLAGAGELPSSRNGEADDCQAVELPIEPEGRARLKLYGLDPAVLARSEQVLGAVTRSLGGPVSRLVEDRQTARDRESLAGLAYVGVVGRNKLVVRNLEVIARVADTGVPVLVRGESGTGKELVARAVHDSSSRRMKPFCAINCAAVPEGLLEAEFFGVARGAATGVVARKGKFELATGGTVFLDEIGVMSPGLQAKLLRVLQEREFEPVGSDRTVKTDVRIVAATNQDVDKLIRSGQFRADLYYRLNAVEVVLPPLRERREDIPELVRHFIGRSNNEFGRQVQGINEAALAALLAHDWPGNIRELQHVIERAVILCQSTDLSPDDLPFGVRPAVPADDKTGGPVRQVCREAGQRATADVEKAMLLNCLQQTGWRVEAAAHRAGFSRAQFYRLLKRHGIKRPE